jgi:hypothetical protein
MRCALAAALLIQSDVLILDEPTNFLVRLFTLGIVLSDKSSGSRSDRLAGTLSFIPGGHAHSDRSRHSVPGQRR